MLIMALWDETPALRSLIKVPNYRSQRQRSPGPILDTVRRLDG
jgi:hypothetical protein